MGKWREGGTDAGRGREGGRNLVTECSPFLIAMSLLPSLNISPFPQDITRGFGFVHFEHADDAAAAIDNMEGAELLGTCLPSFLPPSLPPSLLFLFLLCRVCRYATDYSFS